MKKEYIVRGTQGGIPFEHKGVGEDLNEAVVFVKTRLKERYPRQAIEITGVTEATPIRETSQFTQE